MELTEYRVRPVQRYVVTKHTEVFEDNDVLCLRAVSGGSEVSGEFPNLEQALAVKDSLEKTAKLSGKTGQLAVIERTFDIITQVFYANTKESAEALAKEMFQKTGNEWRVFYPI